MWHEETSLPEETGAVVLPGASRTATTCGRERSRASLRSWAPCGTSPQRAGRCSGSATASRFSARRACSRASSARTGSSSSSVEDTTLRVETVDSAFLRRCAVGQELVIPVKHGEGAWYADEGTFVQLAARGQIVLRYTDDVNGALGNVAGVVNETGNVMGLMPHPEHAVDPLLGSGDGGLLLAALVDAQRPAHRRSSPREARPHDGRRRCQGVRARALAASP